MPTLDQLSRVILEVARPIILEYFRVDSCIASTATVCDVLAAFRCCSMPLVVRVQVFNKVFVDLVEQRGHMPANDAETEEYKQRGAWARLLGYGEQPSGPNRWPGHLATIAFDNASPKRRHLIDLSIDQASRPDKGITIAPLAADVRDAFIKSREALHLDQNGQRIIYTAFPGDVSFFQSPNWSITQRLEAVQRIIAAVQRQLGAQYEPTLYRPERRSQPGRTLLRKSPRRR